MANRESYENTAHLGISGFEGGVWSWSPKGTCNSGDYDICIECAANGIYCSDDAHLWIKRTFEDGKRSDIGDIIFPPMTRDLLSMSTDYPFKFRLLDPQDTPELLFAKEHRFIRKTDTREILIYTDGACSNNGQSDPQAGCAFVYRPSAYSEDGSLTHAGTVSFRLENKGPTGQIYQHTSNRAELRAVIAAFQFRDWSNDCNRSWRSLVIATDSEYVAMNATLHVKRWEDNGWKLSTGKSSQPACDVKSQDLWKLMLMEIRRLQNNGLNVSFWPIPRAWNKRADTYARRGIKDTERMDFHKVVAAGPNSAEFKLYRPATPEADEMSAYAY